MPLGFFRNKVHLATIGFFSLMVHFKDSGFFSKIVHFRVMWSFDILVHSVQMGFLIRKVHLNIMGFIILQIHFLTLGSFFSYDPLSEYRLFVFSGVLVIIGLLVFLRFTLCCRSSLRVWFTLGAWGFFTGAMHLIIVVFFF